MTLSKREKILVTLLVVVGVFGLYINYLILPIYNQFKADREILNARQTELAELEDLNSGNKLKVAEAKVEELVSQMDAKMPSDARLASLYLDILGLVNQSGATLEQIDFNLPVKESETAFKDSYLNGIEVKAIVNGSYENFDKFVELSYENTRKLNVDWMLIESNTDSMTATIDLKAYAFLKDGQDLTAYDEYDFVENKTFGKVNPYR
ncbi:MAG: hypothetical protein HGA49_09130 [Eubacteriaceae bacterium]|nr:hypothetical protein [Eubacteriaceae bacterium]